MQVRLSFNVELALDVTDVFVNELINNVAAARAGAPAIVGAVNAASKLDESVPEDFLVLAVVGEQYADLFTRAIQQYAPPPTDATLLKTLISYYQTPDKLAPPDEAIPLIIDKSKLN